LQELRCSTAPGWPREREAIRSRSFRRPGGGSSTWSSAYRHRQPWNKRLQTQKIDGPDFQGIGCEFTVAALSLSVRKTGFYRWLGIDPGPKVVLRRCAFGYGEPISVRRVISFHAVPAPDAGGGIAEHETDASAPDGREREAERVSVVEREPRIAVVITCFNYETYVSRAIQSVLDQNVSDCELVVIDDGSTDGSWDVIQRTGVRAYQIANGGQRSAALYGLGQTRAPFILFLDADDELLPGAIDRILQTLDANVAKVQFCLTCIDANGHVITERYPTLEAFRSQDRVVNEILLSGVYQTPPTSGNVFRRDVCEILRQCDYDRAVDGVILLIAPFMGDVVSLSETLGLYRVHGQNDSGLGRAPQAVTFERDLRRFQLRMVHLRRLVQRLRPDAALIEAEQTYYFRFLDFSASLVRGSRYGAGAFIQLLRAILTEPRPWKWKIASALFFVAMFLSPMRQAQTLLAFRFSIGRRSARQLLRTASASQ